MCEQCSAKVDIWPIPLEGWLLVCATQKGLFMSEGDWGLVQCNDPDYIWVPTPTPEPPEPGDAPLDDPAAMEWDKWYEEPVEEFATALQGDPVAAWSLVQAAIKCGYDTNTRLEPWLFNFLGKWIEAHKPFGADNQDEEYMRGYGSPPADGVFNSLHVEG